MSFRRGPLVVIVVLLSVALFSWDDSRRDPKIESAFPDGYTASVGPGIGGRPCGYSAGKTGIVFFITVFAQSFFPGHEIVATGGGFLMQTGWKVRAVHHGGSMFPGILIRIENGPYTGVTCWLPSDVPDAFKNIQPGGSGG
jgi:hypothetical protein